MVAGLFRQYYQLFDFSRICRRLFNILLPISSNLEDAVEVTLAMRCSGHCLEPVTATSILYSGNVWCPPESKDFFCGPEIFSLYFVLKLPKCFIFIIPLITPYCTRYYDYPCLLTYTVPRFLSLFFLFNSWAHEKVHHY